MTIRGYSTCIHALVGMQSFVLFLQVCILVFCQNQQESILVESWSPKAHSFSTNVNNNRAIRERNVQKNSHFPQLALFSQPRVSVQLAAAGSLENLGEENESDDDDDDANFIEVESLTASQVTELIELSFFQACYALSKGDVDPLKLFIVAVVTATKKYPGASATALTVTVDALPPSMRPLEAQERDLRETWIKAIFLMMGHVLEGFETDETDAVAKTYGPILVDLVAIHRTGMGLNVNQFVASRRDELLPKRNPLILEDGPEDDDMVKLSVVTQTINVLYTTLVVLDEEYEESSDPSEDEELPPAMPEPAEPAKKSKKKGKKTPGSGGGKGFG